MNRTKTSNGESKAVFRHTALTRQEVVCHSVHKEEIQVQMFEVEKS